MSKKKSPIYIPVTGATSVRKSSPETLLALLPSHQKYQIERAEKKAEEDVKIQKKQLKNEIRALIKAAPPPPHINSNADNADNADNEDNEDEEIVAINNTWRNIGDNSDDNADKIEVKYPLRRIPRMSSLLPDTSEVKRPLKRSPTKSTLGGRKRLPRKKSRKHSKTKKRKSKKSKRKTKMRKNKRFSLKKR